VAPITSPFGHRTDALEVVEGVELTGKVAVVTGAASGIGVETARALAATGATVVMPVRDRAKGERAAAEIRASHPDARLDVVELDLADLESVRRVGPQIAAAHPEVHILVNNAGVMATPQMSTAQGFELQFGTNHVGHHELFNTLLGPLFTAEGARVVALTSIGHRRSDVDLEDPNFERTPYDRWLAYGRSKTACSLFAVGVSQMYGAHGIWANAVHPGGIMTGLQQWMEDDEKRALGWIDEHGQVNDRFKSPAQGASTSVWAAVGPELEGVGGLYLEDCHEAGPWSEDRPFAGRMDYAVDPDHAMDLWMVTERLMAVN
jgi:NAD(P)-dependent dehydrogenase (short-subunit alcohol dehydrogenase family)